MRLSLCQIDGSMSLPLKKEKKDTRTEQKEEEKHAEVWKNFGNRFVCGNMSVPFQISLFLFLKTKFSFGKTNRIRFYKEFLTPYMKLGVRVPDSQILFENYQIKILLIFCPIFFSIKIHDSTKSNTSMESLTLPIK